MKGISTVTVVPEWAPYSFILKIWIKKEKKKKSVLLKIPRKSLTVLSRYGETDDVIQYVIQ